MTAAPPGRWNHNTHYYGIVLDAVPPGCARALDVGCGDGLLVRALAGRAGEVTGLDADARVLERARAECAGLPDARLVLGDLLTTDLPGGYDLIACVTAIHHLPFEPALRRMADLLRPGGRLVIVGLAAGLPPVRFLAGGVWHRILKHRYGFWEHTAPVAEPELSWGDVRRTAHRVLPRSRYRPLLLWRYALTWTKPAG